LYIFILKKLKVEVVAYQVENPMPTLTQKKIFPPPFIQLSMILNRIRRTGRLNIFLFYFLSRGAIMMVVVVQVVTV